MKPWWGFYNDEPLAFLSLEVMNLNTETVLITSADVSLNGTNGKLDRKGAQGPALSYKPEDNDPVLLKPGEKAKIDIKIGFLFKGIHSYLKPMNLERQAYYPIDGDRSVVRSVSYIGLVDHLNLYIEELYGKNASIEVNLYSGYKTLIHTTELLLTEGSDMFDSSGNIDWAAFLGDLAHIKQTQSFIGANE
ncbi:hypothetical protein ACRRS0_05045 [Agarivorans sp. QJM3NY_29]|uniref:hypothetical protein n=1 Tax=unclassified Agarivorans TaxID=2636026 RepID=UPI003D7EA441